MREVASHTNQRPSNEKSDKYFLKWSGSHDWAFDLLWVDVSSQWDTQISGRWTFTREKDKKQDELLKEWMKSSFFLKKKSHPIWAFMQRRSGDYNEKLFLLLSEEREREKKRLKLSICARPRAQLKCAQVLCNPAE